MSLPKVLEEDYRILHHMCHISKDFVEGIRAKLIEKDNNARWNPATVEEVCALLWPAMPMLAWVCHVTPCEPSMLAPKAGLGSLILGPVTQANVAHSALNRYLSQKKRPAHYPLRNKVAC